MASIQFSWKILSVDDDTKCMVVEYTHADYPATKLNIPKPLKGDDISYHISQYAPVQAWVAADEHEPIEYGQEGTHTIEMHEDPADEALLAEAPNFQGNISDEYLRAMIYQVLQEIEESKV